NVSVLASIDQAQSSVNVAGGSTVHTTIRLNGVGSITGHTLDSAGNPIAGHVSIFGTGAFPYSFSFDTNADGSFSVPQVLAGNFTASLSAQVGALTLFGSTSASVQPKKNTDINVQVQPSGSVSGTVLRSDGATPAAGANVTLQLDHGGSVIVQAQTDGTFSAKGLPLDGISIRINDPVSTGQAVLNGLSLTTNGQSLDTGTTILNDTPMAAASFDPADGATQIPANQTIKVAFTNALQSLNGIR